MQCLVLETILKTKQKTKTTFGCKPLYIYQPSTRHYTHSKTDKKKTMKKLCATSPLFVTNFTEKEKPTAILGSKILYLFSSLPGVLGTRTERVINRVRERPPGAANYRSSHDLGTNTQ